MLSWTESAAVISHRARAVTLNPSDAIAHNLYGTALEATGRNAEAQHEFQAALQIQPDFANARFNFAHALAKAGKKLDAIQNLQMILKKYPDDAAATECLTELLAH